jgi:hypothetical protein
MNLKVDLGLTRVDLTQETKVRKTYISALGQTGAVVGDAILAVSKS